MRRRAPLALLVAVAALCATLVVPSPAGAARRGTDKGRERLATSVERWQKSTVEGTLNQFPIDRGGDNGRPDWKRWITELKTRSGKPKPQPTPPTATTKALVLYDSTGPWGWLGELYGTAVANLTSHFGTYTAKPVVDYVAGEMNAYTGVVYVGSTYDEPLPVAFLDDVLAGLRPVMWADNNIWQLAARSAAAPGATATAFASAYGFMPGYFEAGPVGEVIYKGTSLTRYLDNPAGIMNYSQLDAAKASVVATAVRGDGTTAPWAVRGKNLTYIGENPLAYITENDRYLAFSDLLFDLLAPTTPERHRALVRLEDIGPDADPVELRALADALALQGVPFTFIVYPVYKDPHGVAHGGVDTTIRMSERPEVAAALKYMIKKGGTMVMHGYTHQFERAINPYDGQSGNDFEFFTAHEDPVTNHVIFDGPVPGDSEAWARGRIDAGLAEFKKAGLPAPTIWEFPHYAGSAADYKAVRSRFSTRYERSLYYPGVLSGKAVDNTKWMGQFFPYKVHDVYDSDVIPENLGNYEPEAYNQHPIRLPSHIIETARRNSVVRDGVASFFYHPFLGVDALIETVVGIKAAGYTFVAPTAL